MDQNQHSLPDTRATKEKARRKKSRETAAEWRAWAAAEGRPLARHVDNAVVEAVAFLLASSGETVICAAELVEIATLTLQRNGFDRLLSKRLTTQRIKPRPLHAQSGWIPSFAGVDDLARVHPPENGRLWSQRDADRLNEIVGHTPNARAPSAPPLPPHTA